MLHIIFAMELRQLNYFVKVAQTLNFSEAARLLFVTQSTLSQQIKTLEDELGTQLFQRDSHSVRLTESGARLLPLAEKTLLAARDCKNQISDLKTMLGGELVIGTTFSFCPILKETLRNFMAAYPGVKLTIHSRSMNELMEMLRKREVDFVLAFRPLDEFEEIESHVLFDDRLSVIMRNDHPLARKESLSFKDIERQSLVMPAKGLQARNALEHLVDLHATPLNVRVELNDVTLLLDIVQEGQSISLLSASTLYHRPLLKAVPLDIPQNRMMGCIHLLKKAYRKKSAEVFLRMLSESSEVSAHNNR